MLEKVTEGQGQRGVEGRQRCKAMQTYGGFDLHSQGSGFQQNG